MKLWIFMVLGLTACSAKPKLVKVPTIDIQPIDRSYPSPMWEEPMAKSNPEESADKLRESTYSAVEYLQLEWCTP